MKNQEIKDRIKTRMEEIPVPDSLQPDKIEEKLQHITQKKKTFSYKKVASLLAACFVVIVLAGGLLTKRFLNTENNSPLHDSTIGSVSQEQDTKESVAVVDTHATYEEICDIINEYNTPADENFFVYESEKTTASDMMDGSISSDATAKTYNGGGSDDYSETDLQVAGVMEGDIVKTDGTYIYTIEDETVGSSITIYDANNGKPQKISSLTLSSCDCEEMYIQGDTIILIGETWQEESSATYDVMYDENNTFIRLIDISAPANPKETHSLNQSGSFETARLHEGFLYVFSEYSAHEEEYDEDEPEKYVPNVQNEVLPESDLFIMKHTKNNQYLVMTSLNLEKPDNFHDKLAVLGGGSCYYMSQNNLYVTETFYDDENRTGISKYSYNKGNFKAVADTTIRGNISDSYYMHEYEDNFCFVYTRYSNSTSTNGLCVLDKDLEFLGEIKDLGEDERIYSSYYMDNMAYFVTYRETDPVFAVDISDPKKPELKSELKLPGFSSYLHSFGEDFLIGIGNGSKKGDDEDGEIRTKLSLFSIGENYELKEISTAFEKRYTEHIANQNHKAVFVDEERKLIGFAVENYDISAGATQYVVYEYTDGDFKKVMSHSISDIYSTRGVRIGDIFYVVDVSGEIQTYDMTTWDKVGLCTE